jgi:hypothetical protein
MKSFTGTQPCSFHGYCHDTTARQKKTKQNKKKQHSRVLQNAWSEKPNVFTVSLMMLASVQIPAFLVINVFINKLIYPQIY